MYGNSRQYIVMDFAQNCELPYFGENQAEPTYYYTPLRIIVFGIVDTAAMASGHLSTFVYTEIEGKKSVQPASGPRLKILLCNIYFLLFNSKTEKNLENQIFTEFVQFGKMGVCTTIK